MTVITARTASGSSAGFWITARRASPIRNPPRQLGGDLSKEMAVWLLSNGG